MSELLTVRDVAAIMKCSEDSVMRLFAKMPGVVDWGRPDGTVKKRRYRKLLVPKSVLEEYLSKKARHTVRVQVPERPERRRKSATWEERAILNLAKAGVQNECKDRRVFQRIAAHARTLTLVPETMWAEVMESVSLFDDEEDRYDDGRD